MYRSPIKAFGFARNAIARMNIRKYLDIYQVFFDVLSKIVFVFRVSTSEFIPAVLHFIVTDKEAASVRDVEFSQNIVNPISLKQMIKKKYGRVVELRKDIEWFAHHLQTKTAISKPINSKVAVKAVKWIISQFHEELKTLHLCSECYRNTYTMPDDNFMMPCSELHILLWTSSEGWGSWPATFMKFDIEEDKVHTFRIKTISYIFL